MNKPDIHGEMRELMEKLLGLGWCDHEAGICTGACDLVDQLHALELIVEVERQLALGEIK